MQTGIRELKDNLSRYIRRLKAGERVTVTANGRVVAELVPPSTGSGATRIVAKRSASKAGRQLTVVTRDERVRANARAFGCAVE